MPCGCLGPLAREASPVKTVESSGLKPMKRQDHWVPGQQNACKKMSDTKWQNQKSNVLSTFPLLWNVFKGFLWRETSKYSSCTPYKFTFPFIQPSIHPWPIDLLMQPFHHSANFTTHLPSKLRLGCQKAILQGLIYHDKEFGFYSKSNGDPCRGFSMRWPKRKLKWLLWFVDGGLEGAKEGGGRCSL